MTDSSNLFSSNSPCVGNTKIKIVDGSLSIIAGKRSIKISSLLTLHDVLHVPNLLSISKLTSNLKCQANFFLSQCEFQDFNMEDFISLNMESN